MTEDVEANLATCLRMIDRAAAERAEVVVLPEFCNHVSWYDDREHARGMALTLDGPFVAALAAKAREHAHPPDGQLHAQPRGRPHHRQQHPLRARRARSSAVSDKQVLMGSERDHLDPAVAALAGVETAFGRVGLYSCMDGVINETPRMLAVGGAQVLLNSLNSFALDEASLHVPVRAVENRVWVVAANKVGPLVPDRSIAMVAERVGVPADRLHGAGESQIVAPDGTVVAIGPRTGEAVVVADIDVALADDKRRPDGTDVIGSRRPELYGPIADEPRGRQRAGRRRRAGHRRAQPGRRRRRTRPAGRGGRRPAPGWSCCPSCRRASTAPTDDRSRPWPARDALVATSVAEGDAHVGVVVSADGVELRQPQLHRSARHAAWATDARRRPRGPRRRRGAGSR